MMYYGYYTAEPDTVEAFVRGQSLGRLVTVGADGMPHIGLYPFTYHGDYVEIHLNRGDEQLADLSARSRCVFEVDEALSVIPSYWVHPEDAVTATAYHCTVVLECQASMTSDGNDLAAQQMRLMARYQPEGGFRAIVASDPMYERMLKHIAAVRLDIRERRNKFKLAQNRSTDVRRRIVAHLRERGRGNDLRAADAIEATLVGG